LPVPVRHRHLRWSRLEQAGNFVSALGRVRGWRRVALGLGFVVIFPFIPALVLFIARHLR
jgi:hypothetical protein